MNSALGWQVGVGAPGGPTCHIHKRNSGVQSHEVSRDEFSTTMIHQPKKEIEISTGMGLWRTLEFGRRNLATEIR
jgi:hypothetical protein